MKITLKFLRIFLTLCFFLLCFSGAARSRKQLTIGIILRLEDKYNHSVTSLVEGIELAKTQFEKSHPDAQVQLRRYSHGEDLASVLHAADVAIKENTPAVIGAELSEEALALGERLGEHKIILMTPTSSNPKVTQDRPFVFRGCFSDDQVAKRMAEYVYKSLKPKQLGVVHNVSSPYTDFLGKAFVAKYRELIIDHVIVAKVVKNTLDFEPIIDDFIKRKVTHVIMLDHQDDLLRFNTQAVLKGYYPIYVGSDGWGSNENVFKSFVTDSPAGKYFIGLRNSYWHQEAHSQRVAIFRTAFQKTFHKEPDAWNAIAYDSAIVLLAAMYKAKDPKSSESIRLALQKTGHLDLVTTENFNFESNNSPIKDLYIYKISAQGIHFEATLK